MSLFFGAYERGFVINSKARAHVRRKNRTTGVPSSALRAATNDFEANRKRQITRRARGRNVISDSTNIPVDVCSQSIKRQQLQVPLSNLLRLSVSETNFYDTVRGTSSSEAAKVLTLFRPSDVKSLHSETAGRLESEVEQISLSAAS